MTVLRVEKNENYTVMSNYHFKEKNMSLKAKGLLSLMLSLPDEWDYSLDGLCKLSKDGRDSVRSAIKELEEFGYLEKREIKNDKGQFSGYDYRVYEKPRSAENPISENPTSENRTQLNTNILNTNNNSHDDYSNHHSSKGGGKSEKTETDQPTQKTETRPEKKANVSERISRILTDYTDDPETLELLYEWLKVRRAKRAAMTEKAIQLNMRKLDTMAAESGLTVNRYLEEIICRGWQAFFSIPQFGTGKQDRRIDETMTDLDDIW